MAMHILTVWTNSTAAPVTLAYADFESAAEVKAALVGHYDDQHDMAEFTDHWGHSMCVRPRDVVRVLMADPKRDLDYQVEVQMMQAKAQHAMEKRAAAEAQAGLLLPSQPQGMNGGRRMS